MLERFDTFRDLTEKYELFKPSFQRDLDSDHVKSIVEHIKERNLNGKEPINGAIILASCGEETYVVDGQHRLAAIEALHEFKIPIYTITYSCDSLSEVQLVYKTLNSDKKVPDYLLEDDGIRRLELMRGIKRRLMAIYGDIFTEKYRNRKQRPYINIDSFMDEIHYSSLIREIDTVEDFEKTMLQANEEAKRYYSNEKTISRERVTGNMMTRCESSGIWLGLFSSQTTWLGYDHI